MPEITIENISGVNRKGVPYNAFKFHAGDYESPLLFPDKVNCNYLLDNYFPDSRGEE